MYPLLWRFSDSWPDEQLDVVKDRLHPGGQFFLDIARQKPQVLAQGEYRPGNQQAVVDILFGGLVQAGGDGQKRLAGARLAHQGYQLDVVVHQHVQCKGLLAVAGEDTPDSLLGYLAHRDDMPAVRIVAADGAVGGVGVVDDGDELVGGEPSRRLQPVLPVETIHGIGSHLDGAGPGIQVLDIDLV